jgi:Toprim-like
MEQHEAINLHLDNDSAGQNFRQYALSLSSKYKDQSYLYLNHKDLNDWLMDSGNKQKKRSRLRPG